MKFNSFAPFLVVNIYNIKDYYMKFNSFVPFLMVNIYNIKEYNMKFNNGHLDVL